eukprot:832936_1
METWLRKHNLLNLLPVIQKEGITIQFIKGCTEEDIRLCSTEISPSVIQRTKFIVACRDYIDIHTPSIHPPTMAPFVVPNNRANPSLQPSRNASSLSSFAPYSNTNNTEEAHPTMAPFFVPNNRANPTLQSRSALLSSPYSNTNNAEKAHPPYSVYSHLCCIFEWQI